MERNAEYYKILFNAGYSTERYENIYMAVAETVSGKVLDMGCGTGDLKLLMPENAQYKGFDFTGYAEGPCFAQGDIYSYPLDGYDWYVLLEVLEHVQDRKALMRIPDGANVIYSVPNFPDPAHLRTYDEDKIKDRHGDLIDIKSIQTFCFEEGEWIEGDPIDTEPCIYLVTGKKKSMTRPKITAVLIAKNEEDHIRQALESVKDADEIVVCDTGSTDKTVAIASEYGKVFTGYKWKNHFADARNYALSKCTGEWVFWMDADDHLAVPFDRVRESIKTDADAINIRLEGNNHVHYLPWLHRRRPGIEWKGAAHNYLVGAERVDQSNDIVVGLGHSVNHKRNPDRTINILLDDLKKNPGRIREKFYLAREYWYRQDYITAKYWYEEYLKQATWKPEKADAYLMLARCLWMLQKGQEARVQCMEAVFINPDFKEALIFLAEMHYEPMKSAWLRYAEHARNNDVLFIRG